MPIIIIEGLLLITLIVITIVIIFNRDLLFSAIIYCAFSFGAMMLYTVVGAADVAFAEAVLGTISTVYFVIAIKSVNKRRKKWRKKDEMQ